MMTKFSTVRNVQRESNINIAHVYNNTFKDKSNIIMSFKVFVHTQLNKVCSYVITTLLGLIQ